MKRKSSVRVGDPVTSEEERRRELEEVPMKEFHRYGEVYFHVEEKQSHRNKTRRRS